MENHPRPLPDILAPAGNKAAFLAAIAAGADAVYCGLKHFSARMEAHNFSINELARLTAYAHEKKVKVYVTMNTMVKPNETDQAGRLLDRLNQSVRPDGLIVQDPAFIELKKQTGFEAPLHLSTLANLTFPLGLHAGYRELGISRVILPRELSIDEIKQMAIACPDGLSLELFVHGALCYGVSGRCYWSSFLGGKSGLRGRCVQPCRRQFETHGSRNRYFSCLDLSLDILVKTLLPLPQIRTWKIEGRKKGPHYVFYTVTAYKMLRDHPDDPKMKKAALACLDKGLGRPATHYNFLPQRPQPPVQLDRQTSSGLFVGKIQGGAQKPYLSPRIALYPDDLLRIGYEDEATHTLLKIPKAIPRKGRYFVTLPPSSAKAKPRQAKKPPLPLVFLIDRREKDLMKLLQTHEKELAQISSASPSRKPTFKTAYPFKTFSPDSSKHMQVNRRGTVGPRHIEKGVWLTPAVYTQRVSSKASKTWWWLPPVIWPSYQDKIITAIRTVLNRGGRRFVLNAPWQIHLFEALMAPENSGAGSSSPTFWAGPFCNIANGLSLTALKIMGFQGAIVSPELSQKDYLTLPAKSPLPLGIVLSGVWPLSISRAQPAQLKKNTLFSSPKNEQAWCRKHGEEYFIYPNWELNLTDHQAFLEKAGYTLFVHLEETIPKHVQMKNRPGIWNWDIGLL